jgi:putative transposase
MPNYIRPKIAGSTIFFTLALAHRGDDLLMHKVGQLRDSVRKVKNARPFDILAFVVLPDHLHTIWQLPAGDCDFSNRWRLIKREFTVALGQTRPRSESKVKKGEAGLWQRRFWDHHIRNEADLAAHLRYCWYNPVKHGLVKKPLDWPLSSLHRDVARGMAEPEWTDTSHTGTFGE